MRKILILFLLLFCNIIFSETIEKTTYRNGVYSAIFKDKIKKEPIINYNKDDKILEIEFQKLKIKNKIPKILDINDEFLEKITITEIAEISTISFYLKENVEYKSIVQDKQLQVNFIKKKEILIPKKKSTIVIDPGHGGKDSGAIGNGYMEKNIALAVSMKLAEELKKDFKVIMTRTTDIFIPLKERAEIGNRANADLFVSIHLNSSKNSSGNGSEVFYYSKNESAYAAEVSRFENSVDTENVSIPFSDFIVNDIFYRINQQTSAALAEDVLNNIIRDFGLRRRGVFGANFAVLRGSNSPSILIELGFMSNYGDVSQFITESNQEKVAKGIADAIRKHFD